MKSAFILLFVAATLIAVWRKLSAPRKAQIIGMARRAGAMVKDAVLAAQQRLQRRRFAYRHMFLNERGELSKDGAVVLAHLTQFCYAFATTAVGDTDAATRDRREGRRQVWIEIMSQLNLEPQEALRAVMDERDPLAA